MAQAFLGLLCALLIGLSAPVLAEKPAGQEVQSILAEAGPGTRWGLVVLDSDGDEIVAIDPDDRFMPASNTKIYTSAAAMWAVARGEFPDAGNGGARVRLARGAGKVPDVVLEGWGDARLSGATRDCVIDCLSQLADAVARRTSQIHDIVGDATAFPDERWSPGMSWNNIPTRSGTAIAALSVDGNEIAAMAYPSTPGEPPRVDLGAYLMLDNRALTVAGSAVDLRIDRLPGSRTVLLTGTIGAEAAAEQLKLGVDDPAHYAASMFQSMLLARGVKVTGAVRSRYRPLLSADDPKSRGTIPVTPRIAADPLAALTPPPLEETLITLNKMSQNVYAELILRRLGTIRGTGSIADGLAYVRGMLDEAGVPAHAVSLSDGSGMSSYNRVSPRATARLLAWITRQPWGDAFRATLPVGGVDGTLAKRFAGSTLEGKIFAKTGSLNATNALAGYMTAASGRRLTFAIYANDVPEEVRATPLMDRALQAIAAAN